MLLWREGGGEGGGLGTYGLVRARLEARAKELFV